MSLLRFLFLYTYVLVCGIQSFAQFGDCIYQYELEQPSELIHEIKLPPTAFANVYGNPYNFRVYGVAETGDTLEMP